MATFVFNDCLGRQDKHDTLIPKTFKLKHEEPKIDVLVKKYETQEIEHIIKENANDKQVT